MNYETKEKRNADNSKILPEKSSIGSYFHRACAAANVSFK